ncbi:kinase-like domain-containing protein [Gigaspora margarita]|uniref:Kinase-like domain-containing protein n=1 Tax=Gigaspora margarita TaxID=4874 RepID=A0A8H4AKK9_GIGMA|nr:kinase-like domain-containing protein [Gigaspora margarita]
MIKAIIFKVFERLLPTRQNNGETNNGWISRMIKERHINLVDHKEFENLEYINCGNSGVIKKAIWKSKNKAIILKQIAPNEVMTESENQELLKEIKTFHAIRVREQSTIKETGYKNVIECFGVSRLSEEETYLLVLEHADIGCLRDYLNKHRGNLKWEQKINIARQITCGLYFLHKNKILHRDLHTGNVVIKEDKNFEDGIRVIIIDFGLSKVVSRNSISHQEIKGLVNFVDPYILNVLNAQYGQVYSYPSDIYSLGVIFWEISSNGKKELKEVNQIATMMRIMGGEREKPVAGSTRSYVELYKKCWDHNPKNRPDIYKVHELIHKDEIISGESWEPQPEERSSMNTTI